MVTGIFQKGLFPSEQSIGTRFLCYLVLRYIFYLYNVNKLRFIVLFFLLITTVFRGFSQKHEQVYKPGDAPHGISVQAWEKMETRWRSYSTSLGILKEDGTTIEGQLIWSNDSILLILKNFNLPSGLMNPEDFSRIRVSDIKSMKVRLGGQPYQGLIIGILAGVVPGFITGAILAQGWTIIPAIVFGAITAGGGGVAGSFLQKAGRKQEYVLSAGKLEGKELKKLRNSALFPEQLPEITVRTGETQMSDFDDLVKKSPTLQLAFPDNPISISVHSSLMTNSVRKRMQNWYLSPLWGPSDPYYETRIGLEADLSRRIGKRFQAGVLFQMFPGDISSSYFTKNLPESDVFYSYNHFFKQTTYGIYGGWLLHPADRYWATRLEASIQAGVVVSDIYEHFYFNWTALSDYTIQGETFIQKHNFQPGGMLRLQASWYLIPGFSMDAGMEGFWIKRVSFSERTVLPQTATGPVYITHHTLNFSNLQGYLGLSVHF